MKVYYNDNDPKSCAWLAELIGARLIPAGTIDNRSITEVQPEDLRGFDQCHFFAGIGGWSEALRLAGWPADRPVWTGSCPCQPFSCAGKRQGASDDRNLWPAFMRLIRECRPDTIFGEQVNAAIRSNWFDRVSADLEAEAYAVGSAVLGAHSAGADHIRQRLFWVAHCTSARFTQTGIGEDLRKEWSGKCVSREVGRFGRLADAEQCGHGNQRDAETGRGESERCRGLGKSSGEGLEERGSPGRVSGKTLEPSQRQTAISTDSKLGFWSSAIWHQCRDGKARRIPRVEPRIQSVVNVIPADLAVGWSPRTLEVIASGFPLAPKHKGRVMMLKGAGNAICVATAAEFIQAYLEIERTYRA